MARDELIDQTNRKILLRLQELLMEAGRGAVTKVEDELGLHRGFYRNRRRYGRIDAGVLVTTLRMLGVMPWKFFQEVLEEIEPKPEDGVPVSDTPEGIIARRKILEDGG